MSLVRFRLWAPPAGIAHLVERHLAKVEVASSSLVARSTALSHAKAWERASEKKRYAFAQTAYNMVCGDIAKW